MKTVEKTLSVTEARKHMFEITERVQTPGVYFTLTERGRSRAVLMSSEEFESWTETLDILTEFPTIKRDVRRAQKDFKEGKTISLDAIKKKYALSRTARK